MPIEIRELVIRTVLSPEDAASPAHGEGRVLEGRAAPGPLDLDLIVQECVRQVMQVLARDRER